MASSSLTTWMIDPSPTQYYVTTNELNNSYIKSKFIYYTKKVTTDMRTNSAPLLY